MFRPARLNKWFRHIIYLSLSTTLALQLFQVMRMGSAVLTGILLAKSGLRTAEIGAWEMLLYLGTTVTFFWVNGLLQGMAPVYARLDDADRRVFLFNNFLIFTVIAGVVFGALRVSEPLLTPALTGLQHVPHFSLYAWYLLFSLPCFPVETIYMLQKRPWQILWWGMASFGVNLLALFVPLFLGYGLDTGLQVMIAWSFLRFLWTAALVWRSGTFRIDRNLIRQYLRFSAPLMLSGIVSNLLLLIDNWLVGWHYRDPAIFAIYRYGARELPLAPALVAALGTSLVLLLAEEPEKGLQETKAKSLRLMHLLFPLSIVLLVSSKWLFPLVFNPDFGASAALFNIYLLTLASRVLLPGSIVLAKGDSLSLFRISMFELIVKAVLGFTLIQYWGLPGLAWSVVLSFWVEKLGLIWILERRHGIKTADWLAWRPYLVYVAMMFATYFFTLIYE